MLKRKKLIVGLIAVTALVPILPSVTASAVTTSTTASVSTFDPTGWFDGYSVSTITSDEGVVFPYARVTGGTLSVSDAPHTLCLNGSSLYLVNTGSNFYETVITAPKNSTLYIENNVNFYVSENHITGYVKVNERCKVNVADTCINLKFQGDDSSSNATRRVHIIPVDFDIPSSPTLQLANCQEVLNNMIISNSTTTTQLNDLMSQALSSSGYFISVTQTDKVASTESIDGKLKGTLSVINMSDGTRATSTFNLTIPKLGQSIDTISTSLNNFVTNYNATNSSKTTDFINSVAITNPTYNISVGNWSLSPATDTTQGQLNCVVNLNEGSIIKQSFNVSKSISKLATTTATAKAIVTNLVNNYAASNSSDQATFLDMCKNAVSNNINITIPVWTLTKATDNSTGSLISTINISDGTTTDTVSISKAISYLPESIDTSQSNVQNAINNLSASNYITKDEILNIAKSAINTNYFSVSVDNFQNTNSTETSEGNIKGTITITDKSNGTITRTVTLDKTIKILSQTLDSAKTVITELLDNYSINNDTTKDIVLNAVNKAINTNYITATIDTFDLVKATETTTGSASIVVGLSDGTKSDTISKNYEIGVQKQSVQTVKASFEKSLTDMKVTNNTIASDIIDNVLITNQSIKVKMNNFNIIAASETKSGLVTGTINISDGVTSEDVDVNLKIEQSKQSVDTVQALFQKRLNDFVATNNSDKSDILSLVYVNNDDIDVTVDNYSIKLADQVDKGALIGTINILNKATNETRKIDFNKEINLLSQDLSASVKAVQNVIYGYSAANNSTFEDLLQKCNSAVTNNNIVVYYKLNEQLEKVDATEFNEGHMKSIMVVSDGTTKVEIPFNISVEKLPQTLQGANTLITACLNNFKATNNTTEQDVLNAVTTNIKSNLISVAFGSGLDKFDKVDATKFVDGKILGAINITDGTNTVKIPVNLNIDQLPQSIEEAEQGINIALPNFIVTNDTTPNDIKKQIEDVCAPNIVVAIKDFNKTVATLQADGKIDTKVILVDKISGNSMEVPLNLIIKRLNQTLDEAKDTINLILPSISVTNDSTADTIKKELQEKVGDNIDIDVKDFNKTPATINANGEIKAVVVVTDKSTGASINIPVDLTINKLHQTLDEAKDIINFILPSISVTNDSTADTIKKELQDKVGDNIDIDVKDFNKTPSTINANGEIKAVVVVTDKSTGASINIPVDLIINKLQQSLDEAKNTVENTLPTLPVSNDTTKDDLKKDLQDKVGDNITIVIGDGDFSKTPSTITEPGEITGTVTIIDNNTGNQTTVPISITIPKLSPTSGGTGSSGGSGGSSNHHDDDDTTTDTTTITVPGKTNSETKSVEGSGEWKNENGVWHYYRNGVMVKGWIKINELWYYFDINGVLKTGWLNDNGIWYYLNPVAGQTLGAMLTGWQKIDGVWYYLNVHEGDPLGSMVVGWKYINEQWYYLQSNGAMKTGWLNDNGMWYYLNSNGSMVTGWLQDLDGKWYYLNVHKGDPLGSMVVGWKYINGQWYYLQSNGAMKTGWLNDNGIWYYLNSNGSMLTGWFKDSDGKWYYLNSSGAMQHDTTIDGYKLGSTGAWY